MTTKQIKVEIPTEFLKGHGETCNILRYKERRNPVDFTQAYLVFDEPEKDITISPSHLEKMLSDPRGYNIKALIENLKESYSK